MVYDCIPFFNEIDILNLRLHILDPLVDVEAPFTFHKWRGKNAGYPRFENPWVRRWRRFKDLVRPFLFWRR